MASKKPKQESNDKTASKESYGIVVSAEPMGPEEMQKVLDRLQPEFESFWNSISILASNLSPLAQALNSIGTNLREGILGCKFNANITRCHPSWLMPLHATTTSQEMGATPLQQLLLSKKEIGATPLQQLLLGKKEMGATPFQQLLLGKKMTAPLYAAVSRAELVKKMNDDIAACKSLLSERLVTTIDDKRTHNTLSLLDSHVHALRRKTDALVSAFSNLSTSVHTVPELMELPSFVLPNASRELLTNDLALQALDPSAGEPAEWQEAAIADAAEETTSDAALLLETFAPELVLLYIGARQALEQGRADGIRQALVSFRALFHALLDIIAPKDDVVGQLKASEDELVEKGLQTKSGEPTWSARFQFACAGVATGLMATFVERDARAFAALLQVMNAVHEPEIHISDAQIRVFLLRADSFIVQLLSLRLA